MRFSESVSNYFLTWEWSDMSGVATNNLQRSFKEATASEIITQYNLLSYRSLWTDTLSEIFYNNVLERLMSSTFSIFFAYNDFEAWTISPVAFVNIGYNTEYHEINNDGTEIAPVDAETTVVSVLSTSLDERIAREVKRMILSGDILTIVREGKVLGVESKSDPNYSILFGESSDGMRVETEIQDDGEFNTLNIILENLVNNDYNVVDEIFGVANKECAACE